MLGLTYADNKKSPLPFELIPYFAFKNPMGLDVLVLNQRMDLTSPDISDPKRRSLKVTQDLEGVERDLVRTTLLPTRDDVRKLGELVLSELDESSKPIHLSFFVLTMSYIMTCMVKARDAVNTTPEQLVYMGKI